MKAKTLFIIVALCAVFSARADELARFSSQFTTVYTNITFSSSFTNSTTITNVQNTPLTLNHTFKWFYTAAGTNSTTINIDRTIDGANWVPVQTNTLTASGSGEFTASGKWSQYRFRVTALTTNGSLSANYMSQ